MPKLQNTKSEATTAPEPSQIALFDTPEAPDPFRKAVQAIHIAPKSGPLSLQQQKMFDALIKNAATQNRESERTWFTYSLGGLIDDVGLNTKNREYVKTVLNSLVGCVVNWDHLAGGKSEWNATGLVAAVKLSGSILSYQFSDNMRDLLTNPRIYANIDMRVTKKFKRSHALTLWQNVFRYENVGQTPRWSVQVVRELILGIDSHTGSYSAYKAFKSRILAPAIKEIDEVTDHAVEMIEFRTGKTVSELQFRIVPKQPKVVDAGDTDLVLSVTSLKVPSSEATKAIAKFGRDRVQQAVQYTLARAARKGTTTLDNKAAYFRKALEGGWQMAEGTPVVQQNRAVPGAAPEVHDQLVARCRAYRAKEAEGYFGELEPAERNRLVEQYDAQQTVASLKVSGKKRTSKSIQSAFYSWLAVATWGEPTDKDLLTFLLTNSSAG